MSGYRKPVEPPRGPIEQVQGIDPQREGEVPEWYGVGHIAGAAGVVTERIVERVDNLGDHGEAWFDCYLSNGSVVSLSARAVAVVRRGKEPS